MADNAEYKQYVEIKAKYDKKLKEAKSQLPQFEKLVGKVHTADSIISAYLKKTDYNAKDLKKIKSKDAAIMASRDALTYWVGMGVKPSDLVEYKKQLELIKNKSINPSLIKQFDNILMIID